MKVNVELNFNYKKANRDKFKETLDQPTNRITITEEIITKDIINKYITKWMEKISISVTKTVPKVGNFTSPHPQSSELVK